MWRIVSESVKFLTFIGGGYNISITAFSLPLCGECFLIWLSCIKIHAAVFAGLPHAAAGLCAFLVKYAENRKKSMSEIGIRMKFIVNVTKLHNIAICKNVGPVLVFF